LRRQLLARFADSEDEGAFCVGERKAILAPDPGLPPGFFWPYRKFNILKGQGHVEQSLDHIKKDKKGLSLPQILSGHEDPSRARRLGQKHAVV
jgi:hypothetical protein